MKILRETLELARVTAKESEVPVWLVGRNGAIREILVIPTAISGPQLTMSRLNSYDRSSDDTPFMIPVGMHRYGKVLTEYDPFPDTGYNLVEKDGRWRFVDEAGDDLSVTVVESADSE
ncbi:MAG: hypothetical protein WBZ29_06050 [Methanocella sp.]